ncbi:MAG: hypothetical protein GY832_16805 [Chloroflexi bacterium]|nr:hypothetical protein [Chloroflexota bacterium]
MTDKEILLDLLQDFAKRVNRVLDGMSLQALNWQPDAEANNIAVTVWHFSRAFDLLKVRVLENQLPDTELWYTQGWAAQTGYDPRGLGWGGFGNLAGYTRAQVKAIPILPADKLLEYFNQVYNALYGYLERMPSKALYQPAPGWTGEPQPAYLFIRNFMTDSREHLGEIKAIKAMWERKAAAA